MAQRFEGALGAIFLKKTQERGEDHDHRDGERFEGMTEKGGQHYRDE